MRGTHFEDFTKLTEKMPSAAMTNLLCLFTLIESH